MLESEEKAYHRLLLSLPKSNGGAQDDMEDEEKENVVAREQSEEDLEDEDPEADLPDALRSSFARLSARQDELAHRQ